MGPRRARAAGRRDGAPAPLGASRRLAQPAEGGARLRAAGARDGSGPSPHRSFPGRQLAGVAGGAGLDPGGDSMKDVLQDVDAWTARGDKVALAMVVGVKRSAPRPPGAKMAINDRGEVSGAVSGGCVEGAVVEVAERVLAGGDPELVHYGFADLAREGGRGALVTVLRGPGAGGKLLIRADGSREGDLGELQDAALRHAD